MYLNFFGLSEAPFGLTPNTQFYYQLPPHEEALEVLMTALAEGEGFIKVTGEVGAGKTLLCRKLLNELPDSCVCAYLPNPSMQPELLQHALALELGLDVEVGGTVDLIDRIQRHLLELHAKQKTVVLVIDEAQALPDASLEALRLLGNLETESKKLLQVVLFGQPELDERLARSQLRQLRQRITFSYRLRPLVRQEVAAYLEHRLRVSGYRGAMMFTPAGVELIAWGSRGIPRLINVIAHKSLLLSFGRGDYGVGLEQVWHGMRDTEDARGLPTLTWWQLASGVVVMVAVGWVI